MVFLKPYCFNATKTSLYKAVLGSFQVGKLIRSMGRKTARWIRIAAGQ